MSWLLIITFIVIGLTFVILEILVIPGFIVGVLGVCLMVVGIYFSYISYGNLAGHLTIAGTLIFTLISLILVFRSKTWNKLMLHTEVKSRVNEIDKDSINIGDKGKAVSKLSVAGKALINNNYFEVNSLGEYIDAGSDIEVVKIDQYKIYVKKI